MNVGVDTNVNKKPSVATDEIISHPPNIAGQTPTTPTNPSIKKDIIEKPSIVQQQNVNTIITSFQANQNKQTTNTKNVTKKDTSNRISPSVKNTSINPSNRKQNTRKTAYNLKWVCQNVIAANKKWYPIAPIAYLPIYDLILKEGKLMCISSVNDDIILTHDLRAKMLISIIWNNNATDSLTQTKQLDEVVEEILNHFDKDPNFTTLETQYNSLIWIPIFFIQYILVYYRVHRLEKNPSLAYVSQLNAVLNGTGTVISSFKCFPKNTDRMLKYVIYQYPQYHSTLRLVNKLPSKVSSSNSNKNLFLYYNYLLASFMSKPYTNLDLLKSIDFVNVDVWTIDYEDHVMNSFSIWFYEELLKPKTPLRISIFALENFHPVIRKQSTFASNTHSTLQHIPDNLDELLLAKLNTSFVGNIPNIRHDRTARLLTIMYAEYMFQFPVFDANTIFYRNYIKKFEYSDILYTLFARRMLTTNKTENNHISKFKNEPGLFYNNYRVSPQLKEKENGNEWIEFNTGNNSTYSTFCVNYDKVIVFITAYQYDNKILNATSNLFQIMVTHPFGCLIMATDLTDNRNIQDNCLTIDQDADAIFKENKLFLSDTCITSMDNKTQIISCVKDEDVPYHCSFKKSITPQKKAIENCFIGYIEMLNNHNIEFQTYFEEDEITILIITEYERTIPIKVKFIVENIDNSYNYTVGSIKINNQSIDYMANPTFEINIILSE